MRIMLAIDGSRFSTRAVRYVVGHLREFGKRPTLTLVHVDPPMVERVTRYVSPHDVARIHARNAQLALRGARRMLRASKIAFRERHVVGSPGACIARAAREERSDLIVMGSHGQGVLKSMLLGSVVARTLALTHVPVLVVR
jgi:nucleotide-binding universal stress UspA family protein